jgi:hypothetical protein
MPDGNTRETATLATQGSAATRAATSVAGNRIRVAFAGTRANASTVGVDTCEFPTTSTVLIEKSGDAYRP